MSAQQYYQQGPPQGYGSPPPQGYGPPPPQGYPQYPQQVSRTAPSSVSCQSVDMWYLTNRFHSLMDHHRANIHLHSRCSISNNPLRSKNREAAADVLKPAWPHFAAASSAQSAVNAASIVWNAASTCAEAAGNSWTEVSLIRNGYQMTGGKGTTSHNWGSRRTVDFLDVAAGIPSEC